MRERDEKEIWRDEIKGWGKGMRLSGRIWRDEIEKEDVEEADL